MSLEDLGIVIVDYAADLEIIANLADLPERTGKEIIRFFLNSMRLNRAISMPTGITPTDDFVWGPLYSQNNRRYTLETENGNANFKKIIPSLTANGEY